jgi:hypothetical protein
MRHFKQLYDTGAVEVQDPRPTSVKIRWTGCVGFDRAMWIEIVGSCERLAELAGGKEARGVVVEGGGDGNETCVATVHWR